MMKTRFLMIALCSAMCFAACDDNDKPKSFLDCDSSYKPRCSDNSTVWLYCGPNGRIAEKACESGYCDRVQNKCTVKPNTKPECDTLTYGTKCLANNMGYSFCDNGKIKERSCSYGCALGACKPKPQDDPCKDFVESCVNDTHRYCTTASGIQEEPCGTGCNASTNRCNTSDKECEGNEVVCETPHKAKKCKDGKFIYEICKNGKQCVENGKDGMVCGYPVPYDDQCDPETFSELCYSQTELYFCNTEKKKVDVVNCEDEYGQGYWCDVMADYYGTDIDAASCVSANDECEGEEDFEIACEHEDDDTGYRHFYTVMYECGEFTSGYHLYWYDEYECKNKCTDEEPVCDPLDEEEE